MMYCVGEKMKKVRIGAVGLGRLGYQHAKNIASRVPNCELVALCDRNQTLLDSVCDEWNIAERYAHFEDMIQSENLDAVVITSPSHLHTTQIVAALNKGLHVFSEKPLATTVEECLIAEKAVEEHNELVFMLGFMRRYDPSYAYAKAKIDAGEIGRPILFRGYSQDPESCIEGAINYAGHSGGQFVDMGVHDIDLARWFLQSEPKSIFAIGGCYAHPEFGQYQDGDNVAALMHFENEAMAFIFAGRTAPHGYNVETEIIGTKGILRIASVPSKNMVEILDSHGVRKECSQDFLERFDQAYVDEIKEFVACILEGRQPEVTVYDGTKTAAIALKCKEAFETNTLVRM
jgi:myo-inositol 2-dehydrogenase / D-chiro-inositol 1-dehydrogenase